MTKSTAAVLIVAACLFVNAGLSYQKTQAKADLSSADRNAELVKYTGGPVAAAMVTLAGWFGGRKLVGGIDPSGIIGGLKSKLTSSERPASFSINDPANGVHLDLTLTGKGEGDPEGRRRIGAVVDWYASGGKQEKAEGGAA